MTRRLKLLGLTALALLFILTNNGYSQGIQPNGNENKQIQNKEMQKQMEQLKKMQSETPEIKLDDELLDKFAAAAKELQSIKEDYIEQTRNVKDKQQAMDMQQEARSDIERVLKKHDLDIQTYNKIVNAISRNPQLLKKVQNKINSK
ncbi:MAG: DUF4168 domain-containing protein [Deferribacterota bacterium]|nr:DUF4168 domain-containing protein [Deferribacterota bacterium]